MYSFLGEETIVTCPYSNSDVTNTETSSTPESSQSLCKSKPQVTWNAAKALLQREIGVGSHAGRKQAQAGELFRTGFYGSLFSAERLEFMLKLEGHKDSVNCLNFNYSGTKLASGSDDHYIKIWNCTLGKCLTSFHSGHQSHVFQAKFMPFVGMDTVLVSSGWDNRVRIHELSSTGEGIWWINQLIESSNELIHFFNFFLQSDIQGSWLNMKGPFTNCPWALRILMSSSAAVKTHACTILTSGNRNQSRKSN